jgi:hypothetical protein
MQRREFLKLSALGLASLGINKLASFNKVFAGDSFNDDQPLNCGWLDLPDARRRFIKDNNYPFLCELNEQIKGTGTGRTVLLWPYLEKAYGHSLTPHLQQTGDCVAQAYGLGIDVLTAVQGYGSLVPERWIAESSTEVIYGGGRVQIAGGKYAGRNGMQGIEAGEFIRKYGVLLRQKYLNNKYDFTRYDPNLTDKLGITGVPAALLPICKLHPVKTVSLVKSWVEVRDSVCNGYPVIMCSNVGFSTKRVRDQEGFLLPGSRPWAHSMLIAGVDDTKRPGGLIINSWGPDWISGPTRLNQPAGSFWADASVIDRAVKQGDSAAISCYQGYPIQDLSYRIF